MVRMGVAVAVAAIVSAFSPVEAQERGRRNVQPSVTLYEAPNFQGRSMTFYADAINLADQGFNDRARSARISGSWRLCEDRNFRSRCEPFADDINDFGAFNFNATISSLQLVGGRPDQLGGPDWRGGYERQGTGLARNGVEGRSVIFFSRPSVDGLDVAATGPASAERFCREAGLAGAVYFDGTARGRRVLTPDGQELRNAPVLRDVLCRR